MCREVEIKLRMFLTSARERVSGQLPAPAILCPRCNSLGFALDRRQREPQSQGQRERSVSLTGIEPWFVQPVSNHFNDSDGNILRRTLTTETMMCLRAQSTKCTVL
jgi:hypothetical protein